jgi:hypothetical protein
MPKKNINNFPSLEEVISAIDEEYSSGCGGAGGVPYRNGIIDCYEYIRKNIGIAPQDSVEQNGHIAQQPHE